MPTRETAFVQGFYYHIYNRGINRGNVFHTEENYKYCIGLAQTASVKYAISIIAYCLMPNHYHFLVRQDSTESVSKFVAKVFNSFVQAVNKQQDRKGPMFEGRFNSVLMAKDDYLVHLCRYIHLNPVVAGFVSDPEDWPHSNYLEWINKRPRTPKEEEFISNQFSSVQEYKEFVEDHMLVQKNEVKLSQYLID